MNSIKILIPGNFIIGNSIDTALEAIAQLIDEARPKKKQLQINIIEDSAFEKSLEDKLISNRIRKYCNVILWENKKEIESVYKKADLILLPQKKCKISMLKEALSMKVVPICLEFEGINDYIDDTCAILVAGKTKAAIRNNIAEALTILIEDQEVIELLKLGGKKKYKEAYCWSSFVIQRRSTSAS